LNSKIQYSIYVIKKYGGKRPVVSFSGGKDSLVVLDLSYRAGVREAVFCDTTIEFKETIDYVKEVSLFYGIDIKILRPPASFFEYIKKFGLPSMQLRWCCDILKFSPLAEYARKNSVSSFITGLRSNESKKRRKYQVISKNPLIDVRQINPIIDWTEKEVWDYIRKYSLPINPIYKLGIDRSGCWACPYTSKSRWKIVKRKYPHLVKLLKEKTLEIPYLNIKDIDSFVDNMDWAFYAHPQISRIMAIIEKIRGMIRIRFKDKELINKVKKVLPILIKDFRINGLEISIFDKNVNLNLLKILVEKAMNCIGCNVCPIICPYNALYVSNSELHVDLKKCKHCLICLTSKKIRKKCLARNYSIIVYEAEIVTSNFPFMHIINSFNDSEIGLIRTRIPFFTALETLLGKGNSFNEINESLYEKGDCSPAISYLDIPHGDYLIKIIRSKVYTKIYVFLSKESQILIEDLLLNIRNKFKHLKP